MRIDSHATAQLACDVCINERGPIAKTVFGITDVQENASSLRRGGRCCDNEVALSSFQ
jgi:hypothetical protein